MTQQWFIVISIVSAMVTVSTSHAEDVYYSLGDESLEQRDAIETVEPFSIEMQDRVWSTLGVEQAGVGPLHEISLKVDLFFSTGEVPQWLDEIAWPRTKAILHGRDKVPLLPIESGPMLDVPSHLIANRPPRV